MKYLLSLLGNRSGCVNFTRKSPIRAKCLASFTYITYSRRRITFTLKSTELTQTNNFIYSLVKDMDVSSNIVDQKEGHTMPYQLVNFSIKQICGHKQPELSFLLYGQVPFSQFFFLISFFPISDLVALTLVLSNAMRNY